MVWPFNNSRCASSIDITVWLLYLVHYFNSQFCCTYKTVNAGGDCDGKKKIYFRDHSYKEYLAFAPKIITSGTNYLLLKLLAIEGHRPPKHSSYHATPPPHTSASLLHLYPCLRTSATRGSHRPPSSSVPIDRPPDFSIVAFQAGLNCNNNIYKEN